MKNKTRSQTVCVFFASQAEDGSCRFELACARCVAGCDDIPPSVVVTESKVPVCVDLMEGVRAASTGTTVATLDLEAGYYRTSAESQAVLECHLEDACVGGVDVENYCADGYQGPCEYFVAVESHFSAFEQRPTS